METRLKSVLWNPKLRLAHKALAFAVFLWLLRAGDFKFWPTLAFLTIAAALYLTPLFRTLETGSAFLILLVITWLTLKTFGDPFYFSIAAIYFTALFYLILGTKDLAFVKRDDWQRILALGLSYPAYLLFFYYLDASMLIKIAALFMAVLIITKSVLKHRLASWLISLLAVEIAWVTLFLPVGFISQASLASLFYFGMLDITYHIRENRLTKKIVMAHVTILILLIISVFASSRWGI